jgi:hypothetical protein
MTETDASKNLNALIGWLDEEIKKLEHDHSRAHSPSWGKTLSRREVSAYFKVKEFLLK